MKIYKFYRLGSPYKPAYVVSVSVWEALAYLKDQSIGDVTSIEELGPVEIVPAKETP